MRIKFKFELPAPGQHLPPLQNISVQKRCLSVCPFSDSAVRVAMKPNILRKENIAPSPGRNVVATSKVKKGTSKQTWLARKASGILSVSATEVFNRQLSVSEGCIGTNKEVDSLTKIKLQLFPVDEVTRIGLEKDGLNPFLELTLKARKKISSVIKHIHAKWGGSRVAIGEPLLLPYDTHLRQSPMSRRWTSKNSDISAGDVYKALQSPAIFRLSYGWFSDHEPQRVSAATEVHNCIKSEGIHKPIEASEDRHCVDATTQVAVNEHLINDPQVKIGQSHKLSGPADDNITNLAMGDLFSLEGNITNNDLNYCQPSTDISIGGLLSEASLQEKLNHQAPIPDPVTWDDNLTVLSIGGLLSEASLQAKSNSNNNNNNNNNNNSNNYKSVDIFTSDSLDAMVSLHVKPNSSSILDAEETCHEFAFKKLSSSAKNVRVTARSTQDSCSSLLRFPHLPEQQQVEKQAGNTCGPQQYGEDSRSLGLRGITWNESLGPFDLGNSMPWKVFGGGNT